MDAIKIEKLEIHEENNSTGDAIVQDWSIL